MLDLKKYGNKIIIDGKFFYGVKKENYRTPVRYTELSKLDSTSRYIIKETEFQYVPNAVKTKMPVDPKPILRSARVDANLLESNEYATPQKSEYAVPQSGHTFYALPTRPDDVKYNPKPLYSQPNPKPVYTRVIRRSQRGKLKKSS
jgi:hypothetical protein